MGLVINRPAGFDLGTVLEQAGVEAGSEVEGDSARQLPVMEGGPVMKERGFVLHRPAGAWEHALVVEGEDVAVAMSRDILDALAAGRGPRDVLVALGYAGWGPGQLEHEVGQNAWLSGPGRSRHRLRGAVRRPLGAGRARAGGRASPPVRTVGARVRVGGLHSSPAAGCGRRPARRRRDVLPPAGSTRRRPRLRHRPPVRAPRHPGAPAPSRRQPLRDAGQTRPSSRSTTASAASGSRSGSRSPGPRARSRPYGVRGGEPDWASIDGIVAAWRPDGLVVGEPLHMDGRPQPMTRRARRFRHALRSRFGLPVHIGRRAPDHGGSAGGACRAGSVPRVRNAGAAARDRPPGRGPDHPRIVARRTAAGRERTEGGRPPLRPHRSPRRIGSAPGIRSARIRQRSPRR